MKVESFRDGSPADKFVAIFDVYIPALQMTLANLKLLRSKNNKLFIAFPSYCTEDEMGQKKWTPYIQFSREKKFEFEKAVMEELQQFGSF